MPKTPSIPRAAVEERTRGGVLKRDQVEILWEGGPARQEVARRAPEWHMRHFLFADDIIHHPHSFSSCPTTRKHD